MDKISFHKWLKKQGRTEEVAERVILLVAVYSSFLSSHTEHTLDTANPTNLEAFVKHVDSNDQLPTHDGIHPSAKSYLWALRYYYQYTDNQEMELYSTRMREARIKRKPFRLRDFRGVDLEQIAALETVGIKHTNHMLKTGKTAELRQTLAQDLNLPLAVITELVKLSDLARIPGMKGIRARLYYDAGVETLENLAGWDPQELHLMLANFVEKANFDGIAPQPAEVLYSITTAQNLNRLVDYE
jgi:hypothetical protein